MAARYDYSFGPGHGPVSGAVNAAGAVLATSMVADLAAVHPIWGMVGGVTAAAGAVLSVGRDAPTGAVAYRAGCWLCAGGWSTWAMWDQVAGLGIGPWSTNAIAALGVGAIGAAFAGWGLRRADRREADATRQAIEEQIAEQIAAGVQGSPADLDRIAAVWRARIARVCNVRLSDRDGEGIVGIEHWPGDPCPGYTIDGNCPPGGANWKNIKAYEEELAADARLPEGCSVKVRPGVDRGSFLIDVMLRNALSDDKPYPREYPHESINDPRLLVYRASDEPVRVSLRQETMIVVGPTGSGKTNTMNALTAELLKCVDVIVCAIDFNGGSVAIPWLMPWRADPDRCPRPAFDWIADTPEAALTMTQAILDVIKDRKQAYAHVKVAADATLLPISAELPLFEIIIDEAAEVLGTAGMRDPIVRQVAENVLEIQRIGRDAGGRVIISSLGATNETLGSRAVKIHSRVKLAMAGTPADELGYLFDDYKMAPEDVVHEGSARVRIGQDAVFIGKVPYLLPSQIAEVAIATSDRRPAPDDRALQVMGDRWARRWEDSGDLLELLDRGVEALRAGASASAAVSTSAAAVSGSAQRTARLERESAPPLGQALADLEDARRRLQEAEPVADPGAVDELPPLLGEPDWAVVESWLSPGASATDSSGRRKPHPRVRMRQLVWDAGDAGTGPGPVHTTLKEEGYETVYQTVRDWMAADVRDGILSQPGGKKTPYFRGPKLTDPYEGGLGGF